MSVAGEGMIEELLSMATEFQPCKKKEFWKSKLKKKAFKRKIKFASSGMQGQESSQKKEHKNFKSRGSKYPQ